MYDEITKENALENAFIPSTTNDRSKKTKGFLGHLFYLFIIYVLGFDPPKMRFPCDFKGLASARDH
jgi:hypothetical protein